MILESIVMLLGFLLVMLVGYLIYLNHFQGEDPRNQSLLINLMPQYSSGHAFGVITKIEEFGDRIKVNFLPRDVDYIELNNKKNAKIAEQCVIFNKTHFMQFPISSHRKFYIALPPYPELINDDIKQTIPGYWLMTILEDKNVNLKIETIYRNAITKLSSLLNKVEGYEITEQVIQELTNSLSDLRSGGRKKDDTQSQNTLLDKNKLSGGF